MNSVKMIINWQLKGRDIMFMTEKRVEVHTKEKTKVETQELVLEQELEKATLDKIKEKIQDWTEIKSLRSDGWDWLKKQIKISTGYYDAMLSRDIAEILEGSINPGVINKIKSKVFLADSSMNLSDWLVGKRDDFDVLLDNLVVKHRDSIDRLIQANATKQSENQNDEEHKTQTMKKMKMVYREFKENASKSVYLSKYVMYDIDSVVHFNSSDPGCCVPFCCFSGSLPEAPTKQVVQTTTVVEKDQWAGYSR